MPFKPPKKEARSTGSRRNDPPESRRLPPQRRQEILDLVVQNRRVDVNEISERFGVSKVTARADLDYLAQQHVIERARGGAVVATHQALWVNFSERALLNRDEKRRIARAALRFLLPGETVILDAGSTVMEFSSCISAASGLTVVTPALNIAAQLGSLDGVELVIIGGRLAPYTVSSIGPVAERQLQDILAHKVFLGTHLIDDQGDLADVSIEVANLKRAMVRAARQVILLADSTKWSLRRPAKAKVAPLGAVHIVVTDNGIDPDTRRSIEAQGIEVVVV